MARNLGVPRRVGDSWFSSKHIQTILLEIAMGAVQVEFSTTTYNALLDVCARSGQIARAEPLLKQMADQGLAPSVITYSTVIKAYCASNQLEQAFKLFEAGVFSRKITKVQSGYSWFQEMKRHTDLDPDEVTFNTLLDGCARYGLYDRGCEVLTVACPGCVAEGQEINLYNYFASSDPRHDIFSLTHSMWRIF